MSALLIEGDVMTRRGNKPKNNTITQTIESSLYQEQSSFNKLS